MKKRLKHRPDQGLRSLERLVVLLPRLSGLHLLQRNRLKSLFCIVLPLLGQSWQERWIQMQSMLESGRIWFYLYIYVYHQNTNTNYFFKFDIWYSKQSFSAVEKQRNNVSLKNIAHPLNICNVPERSRSGRPNAVLTADIKNYEGTDL